MRAVSAWVTALVLFSALAAATPALSHPLAPGLLELVEGDGGEFRVSWKTGRLRAAGPDLRVVLPAHCKPVEGVRAELARDSTTETWVVNCGAEGIVGARIRIEGLDAQRIDALLRVQLGDGLRHQTVLSGAEPSALIPARPERLDVARRYGVLGARHILGGVDHLLFVVGLLLLVSGGRSIFLTVTAFTLGHSATLSLAALGVVHFPPGPIEVGIALTVLILALELSQEPNPAKRLRRSPWSMAAGFGLLHGLGFAGALAQAGLPPDAIPLSLLSFNVGIELGQLAVIAAWLWFAAILRAASLRTPQWLRAAPVYAMGVLASYWTIARAAALF